MSKAPYRTKQMTEILTFLKSVQGRHVTVFFGAGDCSRDDNGIPTTGKNGSGGHGCQIYCGRDERCLL